MQVSENFEERVVRGNRQLPRSVRTQLRNWRREDSLFFSGLRQTYSKQSCSKQWQIDPVRDDTLVDRR